MMPKEPTTAQSDSEQYSISKVVFRVRQSSHRHNDRPQLLHNYQLRETIGQGSFGIVKRALHLPTAQTVAVKICSLQTLTSAQLTLLYREIELQRRLLHQNIAQIYEVIKTNSQIYIFMEYCRNGELFELISRKGPLAEKQAAKIFHQILSALIYLRQNGLSHRDIKPQNILFDADWNAKLIDFGYLTYSFEDQCRTTVCGTSTYMAPEILSLSPYNPELADVWSLGATLYVMLTGKMPFPGETKLQRIENIVNLNYCPDPSLSFQAYQLIKSIFTSPQHRVTLLQIRQSAFCRQYPAPTPSSIDFRTERMELQTDVLTALEEQGINLEKLRDSVLGCRLDQYRALYFLALRKQQEDNRHLSVFRKHNKCTKLKLSAIPLHSKSSFKANPQTEQSLLPYPHQKNLRKHKKTRCAASFRLQTELVSHLKVGKRVNSINSVRKITDSVSVYKLK